MGLSKVRFPTGYQVEDVFNYNLDFHLILENGKVFYGTFFTLDNIHSLMKANQLVYFWAEDMVIMENLRKETLRKALDNIMDDGFMKMILCEIGTIQSIYPEVGSFDELVDML